MGFLYEGKHAAEEKEKRAGINGCSRGKQKVKTVGRGGQRKECRESVFKPKLTGKLFNTVANFGTIPLDMIHTYSENE